MDANYDTKTLTRDQYQKIANQNYPGIAMFARDVNLPEQLAEKYVPGLIIREKAFTDASIRFMGMVTTHRYVILSNHMANLSRFEHGTNWGMHTAQRDSHFKVLGRHTHQGKTAIFLLHLPDDENWKVWKTAEFSLDAQLYEKAVERFTVKCGEAPVPELTTPQWLDRCAFPLGMDDVGNLWPLEDTPEEAVQLSQTSKRSHQEKMLDRYRGCLLGGAVGDALGYPVEFLQEDTIWAKYGPQGIQTLKQAGSPALISDDTQMTLFAANAIVYANQQNRPLNECQWLAYQEWLGTQGDTSRMDDPDNPAMWIYRVKRLHALRAPGNTCLQSIRTSKTGGTMADPINNSKGCGTVMRVAPFGLAVSAAISRGDGSIAVHKMAACDAALTHGHELAWASSSMLAQIIYYIVQQYPERGYRLEQVIPRVGFPGDDTIHKLLEQAVQLALDTSVSDLDGIHALGEGWVAEEALAIAVFCAVRYQNDFASAIRAAVNHKGDSDSTGAICGNILGAWLGKTVVASAFNLNDLELGDLVEKMADQLFEAVERQAPGKSIVAQSDRPLKPQQAEPLKPLRSVGLMYTPLTKQAMAICFDVHKDQHDNDGLPYVFHPFHLAEQMETEYEVCAALLHDVIEDSNHTLEELTRVGFPDEVVRAVRMLTRDPHTHYLDYVARVRQDPIARRVKLADLRHNSDLARLTKVTEQDKHRLLKYRMAQAILSDDLYDVSLGHFRKQLPLSLNEPIYFSVFYSVEGQVLKYSLDFEYAEDSHCEFSVDEGDKLRKELNANRTLPEALADITPFSRQAFLSLLDGIRTAPKPSRLFRW